MLRGYATFLGVSQWLLLPLAYVWGALLKMPLKKDSSLRKAENVASSPTGKWPLVVFSHGLGGTRNTYSQFCSNLASEGYVVLSLEHRDRSGPAFIDPRSGKEQHYLRIEQVKWEKGYTPPDHMPWKIEQLEFRRNEIYEALKAFRTTEVAGQVDFEQNVIMAGHSFGSATSLSMLSQPPPPGFEPLSVKQTVLLDPWVEPFAPSGPLPLPLSEERPTACVIASEAFAIWDVNFDRLQEIVKAWKEDEKTAAYLMTILPWAGRATGVIKGTHETVMKFLQGSLDADLKGKGQVMEIENIKKNKRQIKGQPGELFVIPRPPVDALLPVNLGVSNNTRFFVGGASAALWMHKHEEKRQMWAAQQADGSAQSWGHCMQHSWYWKHRRGQVEESAHASTTAPDSDDVGVNQASEQLVTAVRTGIRSVMDTLVSIENAFREEKAEAERRIRERPAPSAAPAGSSGQQPVTRVDHEPPTVSNSVPEKAPAYSPVPATRPTPQASDSTMSEILAALEKINAKLDK
ncbi:hypothetical protein FRC04_000216 [Tulasnella sp. 424]|nr:hypothetical protein FRC04_000216 [Tulasnella sp. 424]